MSYTLAQASDRDAERQRLRLLERYYDPPTIDRLVRVGVAAGWNCLDVGAGGGSIARWLAERVAPAGSVVAIDLDLTLLEPLVSETLSVRRLDVREEELPDGFDLVHSRLVLEHMPEREAVLKRMIRALRPGGWLVVTDADFQTMRLMDPDDGFDRVMSSFLGAMRAAGWDTRWAASLPAMLERAGLVDVSAESRQTYERGDVSGFLLGTSYLRLRDLLIAHGADGAEIDRVAQHLVSAGFFSPTSWTAWGRRSAVP